MKKIIFGIVAFALINLPTTLVLACHHEKSNGKPHTPACDGKEHEEGTPNQTNPSNPNQSGKNSKDSKDKQKSAGKNTSKPKQNS